MPNGLATTLDDLQSTSKWEKEGSNGVPRGIRYRIPRGNFRRMMRLEVEADLAGDGARRDVVRAAEGGEKVVERIVVREIDYLDASAPLKAVAVEDVVIAHGEIEQAT